MPFCFLPTKGCTYQAVCQLHRKPLNPEWAEKAKKEIKGADPNEKLMWNTPEVAICHSASIAHVTILQTGLFFLAKFFVKYLSTIFVLKISISYFTILPQTFWSIYKGKATFDLRLHLT